MPALLDIISRVQGQEQASNLGATLQQLNFQVITMNQAQQQAIDQTRTQIAQLTEQNMLLQAQLEVDQALVTNLAFEMNLNEDLMFQNQQRLQQEQDALRFKQMFAEQGIQISMEEARATAMANQQIMASEAEVLAALQRKRRALMQVSISLFVMNISANQLVSSLKPLVKNSEEATQMINNFQTMLNIALGPMQFYLALLQITEALQLRVAQTAKLMGTAMAGAFFWMAALTSKSQEFRIVAGAVAGVLTALAIRHFLSATAAVIQAGALATLQAVVGSPRGFLMLTAGLALTGLAVGALSGIIAQAQVLPGRQKRVREGGLAILDTEERVVRDSKTQMMGFGGRGEEIHIHLHKGTRYTPTEGQRLARDYQRARNMGQGKKTTQRVVVNNG